MAASTLTVRANAVGSLLRETLSEWWRDDALRLGASLSYYTLFSLAPILVVSVAVAGLVFGQEAASGRVVEQTRGLVGPEGASAVQAMIEHAAVRPGAGWTATLLGVATIAIGASGAFAELQYALNRVWNAEPPPRRGWLATLRVRFLSFSMVLVIGFLLLVALVVSAVLSALDEFAGRWADTLQPVLAALDTTTSFALATGLFAAIFKVLPDTDVRWSDVWIGAAVTALLFVIGKAAIGLYLGNTSVASVYGGASSVVVILLWVYYSAQILFLGAEFTQVFARRGGSRAA
jgi:membrane protein